MVEIAFQTYWEVVDLLSSKEAEPAGQGTGRWPFRLTTSGDWHCCWLTTVGDCNGFLKGLGFRRAGRERREPGAPVIAHGAIFQLAIS